MKKQLLGAALTTLAVLASASASAEVSNPFKATSLSSGYMVANHHEGEGKDKAGKCGTGKCGAKHSEKEVQKDSAEKAKEGACAAEKMKEGSCGAEKMKEGGCGAEKMKEGSCAAAK